MFYLFTLLENKLTSEEKHKIPYEFILFFNFYFVVKFSFFLTVTINKLVENRGVSSTLNNKVNTINH